MRTHSTKRLDLTGQRYGKLTVLAPRPNRGEEPRGTADVIAAKRLTCAPIICAQGTSQAADA